MMPSSKPSSKQRERKAVQPSKPFSWSVPWLLVCSLVSILLAASWYSVSYKSNDTENGSSGSVHVQSVHRRRIRDNTYREIAESREPLIIVDSLAHRWPAMKTFTPSFLSAKLPYVMAYRQESKRSFITFHDDKPLEPLVNEKWEDFNIKVNTTIPKILQQDDSNKHRLRGPFLYFSQDVATLKSSFHDIIGYLQPISELILSEENVQVNLWIGRAGLVTHTHYDCTYNFFVQLQGRKRFSLFPPDQPLYLYPCLHPHYGHSQVDILEPNVKAFPSFSRSGAVIAEVGPGDMLVVPPFWFHHVETLEESVSVNVWSDAPEYEIINQIYGLPIPFEEEWGWLELMKATKIYIDMMLMEIGISDSGAFIQQHIISQRYRPVIDSGNLNVNTSLVEEVHETFRLIDWSETDKLYRERLQRGVAEVATLFLTIPVRATLDTCLANFIEHLSNTALGVECVYPFLYTCATSL